MAKQALIKDFKLSGGYLFTQPTEHSLSDLEDLVDENDDDWLYKSRRLQHRRWRKILKQSL